MPPPLSGNALIGQLLGGAYELRGVLGAGATSTVYEARHLGLDRLVALKLLAPAFADNQAVRARFQREARLVGALKHPNIVEVLDAGESPEHGPYLVMERLVGLTLEARLSAEGAIAAAEVANIVSQLSSALDVMHRHDIIHRDFKPANVVQESDGNVKVVDFGVGKRVTETSSAITQEFSVLGTLHYMSFEQARGASGQADGRSDQFSLAVMAYEMLCGHLPFVGNSVVSYLLSLEAGPAPLSIAGRPAEGVDVVLCRALSSKVADRFPDAMAFATALASALAPHGTSEPPASGARAQLQSAEARVVPEPDTSSGELAATMGDWEMPLVGGQVQRLELASGHSIASAQSSDEAFILSQVGNGVALGELFDSCSMQRKRLFQHLANLLRRRVVRCLTISDA